MENDTGFDYIQEQRLRFSQYRMRIQSLQEQGITPPQDLLERCLGLDQWLTENVADWQSSFPKELPKQEPRVDSQTGIVTVSHDEFMDKVVKRVISGERGKR